MKDDEERESRVHTGEVAGEKQKKNYLGHVITTACRGIPFESVNEALQQMIIYKIFLPQLNASLNLGK